MPHKKILGFETLVDHDRKRIEERIIELSQRGYEIIGNPDYAHDGVITVFMAEFEQVPEISRAMIDKSGNMYDAPFRRHQ